jgi:uncharacterized membrane protein
MMLLHIIVFFHVLGAFVWVGGMIAIRVAVHPVMQSIDDAALRLDKTLSVTGRLFALVSPFIALLLITGLYLAVVTDGHHGENSALFIAKEAIWTVMTLNFLAMVALRAKARKLYDANKLLEAKAKVAKIPTVMLPINIALGVTALWLGISLRGL